MTVPVLLLVLACTAAYAINRQFQKSMRKLPPGPSGLPFIGNVLDFPREKEWKVYHEWSAQMGEFKRSNLMACTLLTLITYNYMAG